MSVMICASTKPTPSLVQGVVDLDWVADALAIGGRLSEAAVEWIARELDIQCVVDVRSEDHDDVQLLRRHGIELLHLPTEDLRAIDRELIWTGVRWVGQALSEGKRVLIHCEHGIGRSVLLGCCVLVSQGHVPCAALRIAKQAREKVSPSPEQLHAFLTWIAEWHAQQGTACPAVTWDELARIAYCHLATEDLAL
jgi:hypothetical protein